MRHIMLTLLARLSGTLIALSVSGACVYTSLTVEAPEKVLEGLLASAILFGGFAAWGILSLITLHVVPADHSDS